MEEEKDRLTASLSEQFSRNIITLEEYERLLEYINRIETKREVHVLERIIQENNLVTTHDLEVIQDRQILLPRSRGVSLFSWRTSDVESIQGNGGTYTSIFGANRILVNNLPKGRTVLHVNSVFGLTEIVVAKNIRVINKTAPLFSGVFVSDAVSKEGEGLPELYIVGRAFFGNITVMTAEENPAEMQKEKDFARQYEEKIRKKMLKA